MGLFDMFKSKKQNNNSTPPSQNTIKPKGGFDNLPLYEHISGVDCFDIHSKRYNDLQIKIGDHLQVLFYKHFKLFNQFYFKCRCIKFIAF